MGMMLQQVRARATRLTTCAGRFRHRRGGEGEAWGRRRRLLKELLVDVDMAEFLGMWHAKRRRVGLTGNGGRLRATLGGGQA